MTAQEQALIGFARLLGKSQTPYMVVGGLANVVWGEPRATLDIDATVWVPEPDIPRFIEALTRTFPALVSDPAAFVRETRVLPVQSPQGVLIDVIFGILPFEEEAIRRALPMRIGDTEVRFCTAEDLILMKIVSDRERDLIDGRHITRRQLPRLDLGYLEPRIAELSRALEQPEVARRWEEWKAAAVSGEPDD